MDVALDANILIKDLWLQSQNIRLLLDYIKRTDSRLLISQVALHEVQAHFKRRLRQDIAAVESAVSNTRRLKVTGIPDIDYDQIIESNYAAWDDHVRTTLVSKRTTHIYKVTPDVFTHALHRTIERIPPCKENGEGMRDAIIWLSFLEYCRSRPQRTPRYQAAFISENTRDFADRSGSRLLAPLIEDIEAAGVLVSYFPSLEDFLALQAKPISHITVEWVSARIDMSEISTLVGNYLTEVKTYWWRSQPLLLDISDSKLQELYQMSDHRYVYQLDTALEDVRVYEFDDSHIELSLEFYAYAEADVECTLKDDIYRRAIYDDDESLLKQKTRSLVCTADLTVLISARVDGETIEIDGIEYIYRR